MSDKDAVEFLRQIMTAHELGYSQIAVLLGCSPATLHVALATGRLPQKHMLRPRIIRWVQANRNARSRDELRFAA